MELSGFKVSPRGIEVRTPEGSKVAVGLREMKKSGRNGISTKIVFKFERYE